MMGRIKEYSDYFEIPLRVIVALGFYANLFERFATLSANWKIVGLLISLIIGAWLVRSGLGVARKYEVSRQKREIESALKPIEATSPMSEQEVASKFLAVVPSDEAIGHLYEYIQRYGKQWSDDAALTVANLFLTKRGNMFESSVSASLYSKWKNEELNVIIGGSLDDVRSTIEERPRYPREVAPRIFDFVGWREALRIAVDKVVGDLKRADRVSCQIASWVGDLSINFYLEKEQRRQIRSFKLSEGVLTDEEDGSTRQVG